MMMIYLTSISGIPTLVLLDEDGTLLTADGRSLLMSTEFKELKAKVTEKKLAEQRFNDQLLTLKSNPFKPSVFFNDRSVVDKEGNSISISDFEGKIIGLYFSAHWCGPCRSFTPMLKSKYESFLADGKALEIVFISSDRDEHSAKEYFTSEMPWKMLSFEDREGKSLLSNLFEIQGNLTSSYINFDLISDLTNYRFDMTVL
jgi:nucleoredoxin